jgi:hypothetical protein
VLRVVRKQPRLRRQARTGQNEAKPVAEPVALDDGADDGFRLSTCELKGSWIEARTGEQRRQARRTQRPIVVERVQQKA